MTVIKTHLYEINKPSELCQVIYYENYEKGIFAKLTASQIDLLNSLMYQAKKIVIMGKIDTSAEIIYVEIPLKEIASSINKYNNAYYTSILNQLYNLKQVDVMVNTLGKVKNEMDYTLTSFIHKLHWTKHKDSFNKKIKIGLDGDIVRSLINRKQFFSKMYLNINYSLVSKYSKLLYELLKDYEGIGTITLDLFILIKLINLDVENKKLIKWSYFRPNILEKAINEINEKSDIIISYKPIKEKLDDQRLQVTKIKFSIHKQSESRLQELGLIEEPITSHKLYNKSKSKLTILVKNGYKIIDEDMWIQTDIKNNEVRYESEIRIDTWLKETTINDQNVLFEILAHILENCEDPMVSIEDYKIIGVFSKDAFTKNPIETIELLNNTIANMNN